MKVVSTSDAFRQACDAIRQRGERVGFVPTMGALHAGHASLIELAKRASAVPVVSVFVNPTQFGPHEDLDRYPRTLRSDLDLCRQLEVETVFVPTAETMYPLGDATRVRVERLTEVLCGESRPGHFEGVATVVTKFLALTGPCIAVFGRKDYQQLQVVRRLVEDLFMPVEIIAAPLVRESDGLALSSRNARLTEAGRKRALGLVHGLSQAANAFAAGERDAVLLTKMAERQLEAHGARIDYVSLHDPQDLTPLRDSRVGERTLLALAAFVDDVRLIDNLELGTEADPLGQQEAD